MITSLLLRSRSPGVQVELLELHGERFAAGADRHQAHLESVRPDGIDRLALVPVDAVYVTRAKNAAGISLAFG